MSLKGNYTEKIMTRKQAYLFLTITGILNITMFVLSFFWFGWKLCLILLLLIIVMAANNISIPDKWK